MDTHRLLHRPPLSRRLAVFGLLVPLVLAFTAARARAAGESLTLAQTDPSAVVGQATNFTASGTLNPEDTMFGFDVFIFEKNAATDPTCAPDYETESAAAMNSGGNEAWISPPTGFQVGSGPTFDQPFKVTFTGGGEYLLCGYVQSDFATVATGQLRGSVGSQAGPTPGPTPVPPAPTAAAPAVVHAPWITRKGRVLTCHHGTWSNAPTSFAYRWYLAGRAKSVGSGATLTMRRSLAGRVHCRVTAANAAGSKAASTRALRVR